VGSELGSKTKGKTMVKGIYIGKNSMVEICAEVVYFLSSHTEESESCTFSVVEVEMVSKSGGVRLLRRVLVPHN